MSTMTHVRSESRTPLRRAGAWCLAAALVGVAQAAVLLAWSPQVGKDRFSYPLTATGVTVAQVSFFLQHLPLVAGVAVLLRLPAVRDSRTARLSVSAASVGLGLLAIVELVAITARDAGEHSSRASLVENLYGPPVVIIGLALLVAGAALLRQGTGAWAGARWLPMMITALGVYVFVPLSPAINGSFTAGRLGIGGWMLLFCGLGLGLMRLEAEPAA